MFLSPRTPGVGDTLARRRIVNDNTDAWADETETLNALRDAANTVGGSLRSTDGNGRWELHLPGAPALPVSATGGSAFPMVISMPHRSVILPACAEAPQIASALRIVILRQAPGPTVDLAGQKPAGWELVSAKADCIELARTNQAAKGWPIAAGVTVESGVAIVEVRQPIFIESEATLAVIDYLLAHMSEHPVDVRRLTSAGAAEDSAATGPEPQSAPAYVVYDLTMPAVLLTAARLGDALALIGARYREASPVLQALADHPALAEAYITLHGRQE
jgi:hypothetical protein